MKNKISERASVETLYDAIKWTIFGIFAIIYFGLKDDHPWSAIIFIILFMILLFMINKKREKSLNKIDRIFKK